MGKVIWAPSALKDVEAIAEFIERDSVDQSGLFITRVIEVTSRSEQYSLSGRIIPEMGNEKCREVVYGAYRIMYKIVKQDVWITGVVHGARNWRPRKN